jgi:3-deoxy-manno-octulosonate cytidylyltransferase (CMP-KDO synthetase)
MYFSRAPIPYPRDEIYKNKIQAYRHIGIYAYRVGFLKKYAQLSATELEKIESLEQLRVLHHGYKIGVTITKNAPASGVDTQENLDYVRNLFNQQ